jgi:hypothetical protein
MYDIPPFVQETGLGPLLDGVALLGPHRQEIRCSQGHMVDESVHHEPDPDPFSENKLDPDPFL